MMSRILTITLLLTCLHLQGQSGIRNNGPLKVFNGGGIGLHTSLTNDGDFSKNTGLVGLYANEEMVLTGSTAPVFQDLEIAVPQGVLLQVPVHVTNNLNFIEGNIITYKEKREVRLHFGANAFHIGATDLSKVNGLVSTDGVENFTFPVGTHDRLRPLEVTVAAYAAGMSCAYYDENPTHAGADGDTFSIDAKGDDHITISRKEYWRLEGNMPTQVKLSWDPLSDCRELADYISDLVVVGWHRNKKQWEALGNMGVEGNLDTGTLLSNEFVPDDYAILTLGGMGEALASYQVVDLGNYYLTPNGDGINDALKIEGLTEMGRNSIQIFNRYGVLVYQKENYRNEFGGRSNMDHVIKREEGLEAGVYFYLITFHDMKQKHQGYLYLSQ